METPYKAIAFEKHDVITRDTMNAMEANTQWLYANTPRVRYMFDSRGVPARGHRVVIVTGRVKFKKRKKTASDSKRVEFRAGTFAEKCHPNIQTGLSGKANNVDLTLSALGKKGLLPDHRGFVMRLYQDTPAKAKWRITENFLGYWQAIGWRENYQNEY